MKRFLVLLTASLLVASLFVGLFGIFTSAPQAHAQSLDYGCSSKQIVVFFAGYNYECQSAGVQLYKAPPAVVAVCAGSAILLGVSVTDIGQQGVETRLVAPGDCSNITAYGQTAVLVAVVS